MLSRYLGAFSERFLKCRDSLIRWVRRDCPAVLRPDYGCGGGRGQGTGAGSAAVALTCWEAPWQAAAPHHHPIPLLSPPPEAFLASSPRAQPIGLQPSWHLAGGWRQGESQLPRKLWSRQTPKGQRPCPTSLSGSLVQLVLFQVLELQLEKGDLQAHPGCGTQFLAVPPPSSAQFYAPREPGYWTQKTGSETIFWFNVSQTGVV